MRKNFFTVQLFAFIGFFLISTITLAQTGTLSPYSRYGIGEIQFNGFAYQRAMGGLGAALQYSGRLNFSNPASYATDTLSTVEIGADGMIAKLEDAGHSQQKQNANLSYIALGFPIIKHKWGLSIGVIPFSAVGYDVKQKLQQPIEATYFYSGSGGINRFYLGNGFRISRKLYAGFNASYLFGSINREKKVEYFQSGYLNNSYTNTVTINDIILDFGLQYLVELKNDFTLSLGLIGNSSSKINASQSVLWQNYYYRSSVSTVATALDIVESTDNQKGSITFPVNITGGFFLAKKNKWGVGLDLNYQDWSNYKSFGASDSLAEGLKLSLGANKIPDFKSLKYFNRAEYRAGAFYRDGSLSIRNTSINEYGVTAGVGLPLRKSLQSMINISVEFGQRGTVKDNLVKEQYGKLFIGITFNEDWFQKRKYD